MTLPLYHTGDKDVPFPNICPNLVPLIAPKKFKKKSILNSTIANLRSNDATYTYFDPIEKLYHTYGVWLLPNPGRERYFRHDNAGSILRVLYHRRSKDEKGLVWEKPEIILVPDEKDPIDQQFYYMSVTRWNNYYLGLIGSYHLKPQTIDVRLAISRDNKNWDFVSRRPIIPLGKEDSTEEGMICVAHQMVDKGKYWYIYYGASDRPHNAFLKNIPNHAKIHLARIEKARMVSFSAKGRGEILTKPFYLEKNKIEIEYSCQAQGWIKASLCNAFGKPITGFELEKCYPLTGKAKFLKWEGQKTGKNIYEVVSLRIILERSKIFGFKA